MLDKRMCILVLLEYSCVISFLRILLCWLKLFFVEVIKICDGKNLPHVENCFNLSQEPF